MANRLRDKNALLAYKESILRDIKYFEKRIDEARSQKRNSFIFDDDESDSDNDFLLLDPGPSVSQLKEEESMLQTCLHATQELTSLCVLQSEVNIMVSDPVLEGEPPVTQEGVWREVTVDCRVDLVPVTMSYYVHHANGEFGATSYRGLRVSPVKTAHDAELGKSILPRVKTPSDAIDVLRSYAQAHRSRRTTLARLNEKYPNCLFMEPMADGGYILKCAKVLEVWWTLENKWSPLSSFHHRLKFELDYMDEMYVKIISQAHKELADPTLETDERTRLMSKIIATCLEAQGTTQELYEESMESDIESENRRKRRTTLDQENEAPVNKKAKDSEVMAPPKSLPKKVKPKGKENNVDNTNHGKVSKRLVTDGKVAAAKKARPSDKNTGSIESAVASKTDKKVENVKNSNANINNIDKNTVKSKSNKEKNAVSSKTLNKIDNVKKSNKVTKAADDNLNKQSERTDNEKQMTTNKASEVIEANVTDAVKKVKANKDANPPEGPSMNKLQSGKNKISKEKVPRKDNKTKINMVSNANSADKTSDKIDVAKTKSNDKNIENVAKKVNNLNIDKKIVSKKSVAKEIAKSVDRPKSVNPKAPITVNTKNNLNLQKISSKSANRTAENIEDKSNGQNLNSKSAETLNNNNVRIKSSNKKITKNDIIKDINVFKKPNNQEKPRNNARATDPNSVEISNVKQHDTLQKVVVKNKVTNSKKSDKMFDIAKKTAIVQTGDPKYIEQDLLAGSKRNTGEINKNTDNKTVKTVKSKTMEFKSGVVDDATDYKAFKLNINEKSKVQNVNANAQKRLTQSKSPYKNRLHFLNPRDKIPSKAKIASETHKNTRIPQKLNNRDQISKKNPLRISPRKLLANMRTGSRDVSKSSQQSLQKAVTGIPRLVKKPISVKKM